jgi:hypothetical protein
MRRGLTFDLAAYSAGNETRIVCQNRVDSDQYSVSSASQLHCVARVCPLAIISISRTRGDFAISVSAALIVTNGSDERSND